MGQSKATARLGSAGRWHCLPGKDAECTTWKGKGGKKTTTETQRSGIPTTEVLKAGLEATQPFTPSSAPCSTSRLTMLTSLMVKPEIIHPG